MNERAMLMFDAITEIRDDIVEQATDHKFRKSPMRLIKSLGIAASVCLVGGAAVYAAMTLSGARGIPVENAVTEAEGNATVTAASETIAGYITTGAEDTAYSAGTLASIVTFGTTLSEGLETVPPAGEYDASYTGGTTAETTKDTSVSEAQMTAETTTEMSSSETEMTTEISDPEEDITVEVGGEACYIQTSFDEVINACCSVAVLRCDEVLPEDDGLNDAKGAYVVTTEEILLGSDLPETFKIRNIDDSRLVLESGKRYVIPLEKFSSVFFDEDRYCISCRTVIYLDDDNNIERITSQESDIDIGGGVRTKDRLRQYFEDNDLQCTVKKETGFTTSDDITDVVNVSEYILEITVKEIDIDFVPDRTTYTVEVVKKYKGKSDPVYDRYGRMFITMPKNAAEVGKNYIVLVNHLGEGSSIYVVSSLKLSVFPADSPEAMKVIDIVQGIEQ